MSEIQILNQETIDKIAAGEVIERPASVVKELVENAIDAKATAITVEVKDGGTSFIRITDNGHGIPRDEVALAFLRHSTSKIRTADDLQTISSLGFRGEALSSICAVSQVELITKTRESFMGTRYLIEGGKEKALEEIGAPEGTTFLIRNLFYNTPARKKFLKTTVTEGNYIQDLMERLSLSHPEISFKLLQNNQTKIHTTGNASLKDIIYQIYGREIAANLIPVQCNNNQVEIQGFIGKPNVCRGNRQYENYFINGRYVKSAIISKAIEQGYKNFLMQHKYPFTVLLVQFAGKELDVNVHPTKMELRFSDSERIYRIFYQVISESLQNRDLIPEIQMTEQRQEKLPEHKAVSEKDITRPIPKPAEPFEKKRMEIEKQKEESEIPQEKETPEEVPVQNLLKEAAVYPDTNQQAAKLEDSQLSLFKEKIVESDIKNELQIIGQIFDTYWIIRWDDKMLIIDQHAAHEKVLYERTIKQLKKKEFTSQLLSPPLVMTLSAQESQLLQEYGAYFQELGFEIELFGGKEYAIRAIPDNLYGLRAKELFIEMLDGLSHDIGKVKPDMISDKIASMSCKAAVKGNQHLSFAEARELLYELMQLDNPYHCPHGRPVIISMTKTELEKKFKRIV